jgi:lipopolysaccharide/colanic/teichoic acid biosynthesis glycosyltransferase
MKRLFDVSFSSISLILLAVPFVLIALAVKLSSRGSVFYRQRRVGRGGRPFWLYKFRTMYVAESGSLLTIKGDPRITPLGRVLRRWKLDELPQLWNVLKGEMSVIGPRPEVERYVCHYTPEQRRLLDQTPGLAGMAQLVYPGEAEILRDCPKPEEFYVRELMPKKIAVDLQYEAIRTFRSDLQLLFEMVLLIFGKSHRVDRELCVAASEKTTSGSGTP